MMASKKTETTELSVAFGLLGYDNPLETTYDEVGPKFQQTLSAEKFAVFIEEFPENRLYNRMLNVGVRIRENYNSFRQVDKLKWEGGDQQARTVSTARDLQAVNIPISVKAESKVVSNPSPYNLFVATPQGLPPSKGEPSWYLQAENEYQAFYSYARSATGMVDQPETAAAFEASRKKRPMVDAWKQVSDPDILAGAEPLYLELAHRIASTSAEQFNQNLSRALATRSRGAVLEHIAKMFFRMNAVDYILCGIDERTEFAVQIPGLTAWLQQWQFNRITARPDLDRGQSVVDFEIECERKDRSENFTAYFHAEVRWSHGKFSSVEGKLYREFEWTELPFFVNLF